MHGDLGRFDDWLGENGEVGVACTEGGSSSGMRWKVVEVHVI